MRSLSGARLSPQVAVPTKGMFFDTRASLGSSLVVDGAITIQNARYRPSPVRVCRRDAASPARSVRGRRVARGERRVLPSHLFRRGTGLAWLGLMVSGIVAGTVFFAVNTSPTRAAGCLNSRIRRIAGAQGYWRRASFTAVPTGLTISSSGEPGVTAPRPLAGVAGRRIGRFARYVVSSNVTDNLPKEWWIRKVGSAQRRTRSRPELRPSGVRFLPRPRSRAPGAER